MSKNRSYVKPFTSFFFDECFCDGVDFQTYNNTVGMKAPFDLPHKDDRWVTIDTCIATEIGWLWKSGVKTLNSCCGHNKDHSWVIVDKDSESFMDKHYESYKAPSGLNCYLLRTGYSSTLEELKLRQITSLEEVADD